MSPDEEPRTGRAPPAEAPATPRFDSALAAIDGWQRRRPWAAFVVGVARKYTEDGAARHGARIAYYAFFSVFPLLLAFVSILGFALEGNPELRQEILDSTYADMPVIGPLIRDDIGAISGSGIALLVGIAVALWAGLGATLAFSYALDEVWSVAPVDRRGFVSRRLRGAAALLAGGAGLVASSILGGAAASGHLGAAGTTVASLLLSVAVDAFILLTAFWLLTPGRPRLRDVVPGVVVAALALLALQALGGWYVDAAISRATDTYGLFATVIGLLSWLTLAAQLLLIAAEVNAVRSLGLWPRSLRGPMAAADMKAFERYARSALHDRRERITVRWPQEDHGTATPAHAEISDPRPPGHGP
jgi:membrane protein